MVWLQVVYCSWEAYLHIASCVFFVFCVGGLVGGVV